MQSLQFVSLGPQPPAVHVGPPVPHEPSDDPADHEGACNQDGRPPSARPGLRARARGRGGLERGKARGWGGIGRRLLPRIGEERPSSLGEPNRRLTAVCPLFLTAGLFRGQVDFGSNAHVTDLDYKDAGGHITVTIYEPPPSVLSEKYV